GEERKKERREMVKELREKNMKSSAQSSHFSRECSICLSENPLLRATLIECGHICCLACAQQFALNGRKFKCPTCQKPTGYVVMVEENEEKEEKEGEKEEDMGETREKKRRLDEAFTEDESNKETSNFKSKKARLENEETFEDTTNENKEIEGKENN
ncbi:hypothetical protein PFISCL1PPCAC_25665, partial [Pristionchus fissidentatus]